MTTAQEQASPQPSDEVGLIEIRVRAERDAISREARRYARMYGPHSDGRNSFTIFADMIDARSPPSSPVGDGEAPAEIWANPERGTCRAVGSGVWASDTLYVRADLAASHPPEADVRSVPDETKRLIEAAAYERAAMVADNFITPDRKRVMTEGIGSIFPANKAMKLTCDNIAAEIRALASSPAPESDRDDDDFDYVSPPPKNVRRYWLTPADAPESSQERKLIEALRGATDYIEQIAPLIDPSYTRAVAVRPIHEMLPIWRASLAPEGK